MQPARILSVCTANIARSPLAEVLLRGHVHERGLSNQVLVASAGVQARTGYPAADSSVQLALQWGVDLSGHRSQPASPALTQDADLVITMSERQRDWLGRSVAGLHARCFTFKELARLVNDIDPATLPSSGPARIQQAVAQAHHRRPVSIAPPDKESIADPYGGTHEGYVAMANELVRLAAHVMPILLGDRQR